MRQVVSGVETERKVVEKALWTLLRIKKQAELRKLRGKVDGGAISMRLGLRCDHSFPGILLPCCFKRLARLSEREPVSHFGAEPLAPVWILKHG